MAKTPMPDWFGPALAEARLTDRLNVIAKCCSEMEELLACVRAQSVRLAELGVQADINSYPLPGHATYLGAEPYEVVARYRLILQPPQKPESS